jgi:hypothetical protein
MAAHDPPAIFARLPSLLLLLAPLVSCSGNRYFDSPSCEFDPFGWYVTDPVHAVQHADDSGTFSFNPTDTPTTSRKGSYDFQTGDYYWNDNFKAAYFLTDVEVTGYGTIFANADLDLIDKRVTTDVLGVTWADLVRTKRTGCTGEFKSTEIDAAAEVTDPPPADAYSELWTTQILSDEEVDSASVITFEDGSVLVQERTSTSAILSETDWDYRGGASVGSRLDRYDGTGKETWEQDGAMLGLDADYSGVSIFHLNGSHQEVYTAYTLGTDEILAEWSILYYYDGSGTGTVTRYEDAKTTVCDVTINPAGRCSADCGDGERYTCSVVGNVV